MARLPPLQYGELVAQDQDLCGLSHKNRQCCCRYQRSLFRIIISTTVMTSIAERAESSIVWSIEDHAFGPGVTPDHLDDLGLTNNRGANRALTVMFPECLGRLCAEL
jgi:hypothetical protein